MKKLAIAALSAAAVVAVVPSAPANAAPVPGKFCKKSAAGDTAGYKGKTIKCVSSGRGYQWQYVTGAPTQPRAVTYANCAEARIAGVVPIHRGQPGYSTRLDPDGDGLACG